MKPYKSLLFLVTLTVISVACVFSAIGFILIQREARQQIAGLAEAQALGFSQMIAGTIEGALRNGQPLEARSQVMRMSLSPLVRSAYLVDNNFTVIYSTNFDQVGDSIATAQFPDLLAVYEQLLRKPGSFTSISKNNDSIWVAIPVRLPPKEGALISSEIGLLLVAYDYIAWDAVTQDHALSNIVATISLIAAVSIVLLGLLWLIVTRRIHRMTFAAESLAAGNLDESIEVRGDDEIGRLASSLQSLTSQLSTTISNLQESEERLRSIMDSASDAILLVASNGLVLSANRVACQFFGISANAPHDANMSSLVSAIGDVPFMELAHNEISKFGQGLMGGGRVDFFAKSSKGVSTPVEVSVGRYAAAESHQLVFVVRDISERQELEKQIRYMQRMDAVGQLTAGVAHDFNNILAISMGNYELLQHTDLETNQKELVQTGIEACIRGANLSRQLLMFGRRADLKPQVLNMNTVISDMGRILLRTVPESIDVETSLSDSIWPTLLDRTQLESAVLNLVINAKDAMPNGGILTIETENVRLEPEYAMNRWLEVSPGPYVMIAVTDTGEGIPEKDIEHVFEPFFTTKQVGKGSGMGLPMVFGFVKQSGGNLTIYSEPGIGTTVKLYFPRTNQLAQPEAAELEMENISSLAGKSILLVEDDDSVRATISAQLSLLSCNVTTALNGDNALELIANGLEFDLLLTDVVMSGSVQGPDLAKKVLREFPDMPIVLMSGYPKGATENGNGELAHLTMLTKPVQKQYLADALLRELAKSRS